uniref:Uncharacterized protein n=1 Tax=Romanomermis culicivorax TaxID=13658 RepID=A0A915ICU4_ROMCU
MKLPREFNARQGGLGNNFHAMYASCQSRAGGLTYTIAKAVLEDKKDPEPNYPNIQVWKKETDNTDPPIRFWEVIDRKKAHNIVEVEKNLKKKVGYRVKHAYNRPATSKVPRRWVKKHSDIQKRQKSETPDKDRKRKHESRQQDEKCHEKSMSREKRRRENDEESWQKSKSQLLPSTVVPPPAHFQVPQFPIMQFQPGQGLYYHQFLVPPCLQMPPPRIISPIHNVQGEERMDIPGPGTVKQPPQRPPSTGQRAHRAYFMDEPFWSHRDSIPAPLAP